MVFCNGTRSLCVMTSSVCNGLNDCGNWADETNCGVKLCTLYSFNAALLEKLQLHLYNDNSTMVYMRLQYLLKLGDYLKVVKCDNDCTK